MLRVADLTKTFPGAEGPVTVLDGVSFELGQGRSMALTGESGSGKSTLLHVVGGLERADGGRVEIDGADLVVMAEAERARIRRETVATIFQQFNLIPSLDVGANVAFQARLAGRHDAAATDRLMERLGLAEHRAKYPEELSGGQQQRVAIGRALAARPKLVLADEPTGNLDETTGERVADLMFDLVAETGAALLVVTHSERLAARAERRLHLSRGRVA